MKLFDVQAKVHVCVVADDVAKAESIGVYQFDLCDEYLSFNDVEVKEIINESMIPEGWEDGYPLCERGESINYTTTQCFQDKEYLNPTIVELNGKKYKLVELESE